MKILCVLSNMFPYGKGEAYMESEVSHYDLFDRVYIFSLMIKPDEAKVRREIPKGITVVPVKFAKKIVYAIWSLATLCDRDFYKEIRNLYKNKKMSFSRLIRTLVYFSRAHYEASIIYKKVGHQLIDKEVVFYSYRFEYQPYVAILLKRKLKLQDAKIVSRAHRYDLYEERNIDKYIPYREGLLRELNYVFPCSDHGKTYLLNKYPQFKNKVITKYLGTKDCGVETDKSNDVYTIISCSNVIPVKRIDKILDTIKLLPIPLKWIHFGDGEGMTWLKEEVSKLPSSVNVDLPGALSNKVILNEYKNNHFDLFINLSDSEGLPVSIMEAMSFGIPCVATNVGGTSELVKDGYNGLLIDTEDSPQIIAQRILDNMEALKNFRKNARESWKRDFDENTNYSLFVKELHNM